MRDELKAFLKTGRGTNSNVTKETDSQTGKRWVNADELHYKKVFIESEKGTASDIVVFAKEIDKKAEQFPLQEAYRMVFEDMTKEDGCNLFRGVYDAKNGNEHFMYGISTAMEFIANQVSEKTYEKFANEFNSNMELSEEKAKEYER